jgi:hypothetical protein
MITMQEIKSLFGDGGFSSFYKKSIYKHDPFENFNFEIVEQFGGEGMGDHCYYVIKFTRKSDPEDFVYVQFNGYYSSYDGSDYSYGNSYIVEPYEKTIRAWRQV